MQFFNTYMIYTLGLYLNFILSIVSCSDKKKSFFFNENHPYKY